MRIQVTRYDAVDSTSERAFAALAEGRARHGDVVVAGAQTAGRGRLGRRWHSPPGEGLYLSLILLPPPPGLRQPAALTMAAGLAALTTARHFGVGDARLKWPNDLMVSEGAAADAKLAGILVESRGLDANAPHYVVGIGLNVGQRQFSNELRAERAVTSLALAGNGPELQEVESVLLGHLGAQLDRALSGDKDLGADFTVALKLRDTRVRLSCGQTRHSGRLVEVDLTRGVTLITDDGLRRFDLAHVTAIERDGSATAPGDAGG